METVSSPGAASENQISIMVPVNLGQSNTILPGGTGVTENQMDEELQMWINEENWESCLNYCKQKIQKTIMATQRAFINTIKAYCLLRLRK